MSAGTSAARAQGSITVAVPGGYLAAAIEETVLKPFARDTGGAVALDENAGAPRRIAEKAPWDAVLLEAPDVEDLCARGLLARIDPATAAGGADAQKDFLPGALRPCGVGAFFWSTAVVFRKDAFKGPGPTRIGDLFNTTVYPGKRGLFDGPEINLEWALLADGVRPEDIYKELATAEGVDRAFRKLDTIKSSAVFWTYGDEPANLLRMGEVTMTTAYAGRSVTAFDGNGKGAGVPWGVLWDRHAWRIAYWGVPAASKKAAAAVAFTAYFARADRQLGLAERLGYGPVRRTAFQGVPAETQARLPTSPTNHARGLAVDENFWRKNGAGLTERFRLWRSR